MHMKITKRPYPEDMRSRIGFTTISWVNGFATMVFSLFMQFLTDYSGIDAAIGKVGYAAAFGTAVLLVTRIVDAVDDPLQAWIMDRSKETKFGKYRRFTLWSVFLIGIGVILMFSLPVAVKSRPVLLWIWVLTGYLLYEIGCAFNGTGPILQKVTTDANVRTRLSALMRIGIILAVIPAFQFIPIATFVNRFVGNMGKSFTITCVAITIFSVAMSLLGVKFVKEPYRGNEEVENGEEKLSLKDVWQMLKTNKPMWVHNIAYFLTNMAYGVSSAVLVYFLKWYYCADMATGVVDEVRYASIYALFGVVALFPSLLTPLVAGFVVKKLGSVDKAMRVCTLISGIFYGLVFVLNLLGILQLSPFVYVFMNLLASIPASIAVIPALLLNTECADYAEYNTGKNMSAMTTAVNNLVQKLQTAISTVVPGLILISVGYSVNSATGAYAGDMSQLPGMVQKLTAAISLIPMVVSILGWAIYKYLYPITTEYREKMTAELDRRHGETSGEETV